MSRYIDADAIKNKAWKAESEACFYTLEDVVSVTDIDEAPSIDIVRCGECKQSKEYRKSNGGFYRWCHENIREVKDDDFCSYRERKEDE